ncbi:acyl-CoA dehydrogenase family protein [Streptomyces gilvosporeus]|uniref:Acyl-CoA dehydrogenase n=1 Tax=Streptomyces gilvosporeus TaxID=553510 RepID=A0A1V0TSI8_9ACTN|nr:acyl-CoA dehydrogenase family protein [Streptomyces gilvosporeus]ARF55851.1 acyl-CoA dehydrogenase [Streptomyces gilvosporeus]
MDFQLGPEQRALRDGMRELLAGRFGRERLRAAVEAPALDRALWRELAEAGFFALRLPEADGGVGLGLPEAVLLMEETGRALLPGPLVACQLLAGAVDGVATGERIVALAETAVGPEPGAGSGLPPGAGAGPYPGAAGDGPLWEHPADCDALITLGDAEGADPVDQGRAAGAYRSAATDVLCAPFASVDPLTPLARITGIVRKTPLPLDVPRLRREAALLTAAQQLGSAARTVETAVAYAREREQFGAPIGSFQAVKHLCAQMLVRAEIARSAVYAASVTEGVLDVTAAKLLADEAAVRNARDCLQVHGGMGFTWESDVHLHLKRAWLRAARWGGVAAAEEALAAGLIA